MNANGMKHEQTTGHVLKAFYAVYNELGPGFLESVYANAMAVAFEDLGVGFDKEKPIDVRFRGHLVGEFRADFLVDDVVLVELKACKRLENVHIAQTLNYLKATGVEVGLLLNFGPKPEFKRLIKDKDPCLSAQIRGQDRATD